MPRVFTSVSMVATSSTIIARISSEVLVAINVPFSARRLCSSGSRYALTNSSRNLCTIAGGIPGGAATPNQFATFSLP